jgi:hypothetical protein
VAVPGLLDRPLVRQRRTGGPESFEEGCGIGIELLGHGSQRNEPYRAAEMLAG